MLQNSMAASISAASASSFSQDNEKLDLESVSALATTINQHINALLANDKAWMSLKLKCTSKLNIQRQPTFEFSEYSIVSNLYWGIEAIDAATLAKGQEERTSRLSVVRKLQRDDWQAALHFLQALIVSPRLVHQEFAPELCQSILHLYIRHNSQERPGRRVSQSATVMDLDEDQANEIMGWMAKEYKAWLLYYQIMSNGEHGSKHSARRDIAIPLIHGPHGFCYKQRISCVHTQTLEVGHGHNEAVTALIYYKGQLCSGHADGSIKVWDIQGHTATLIQDMKNHNKAVTCFALLEQGSCLLSGSIYHMGDPDLVERNATQSRKIISWQQNNEPPFCQ